MAASTCSETAYILDDLSYLGEEIRQLSPLIEAVPAHDRPGGDHFSILEHIRFIDFIQQNAVIPVLEQAIGSSEQELSHIALPWNTETLKADFLRNRVPLDEEKATGAEGYLNQLVSNREHLVKLLNHLSESGENDGLPQQLKLFLTNLIKEERRLLRSAAEQILAINREEA